MSIRDHSAFFPIFLRVLVREWLAQRHCSLFLSELELGSPEQLPLLQSVPSFEFILACVNISLLAADSVASCFPANSYLCSVLSLIKFTFGVFGLLWGWEGVLRNLPALSALCWRQMMFTVHPLDLSYTSLIMK